MITSEKTNGLTTFLPNSKCLRRLNKNFFIYCTLTFYYVAELIKFGFLCCSVHTHTAAGRVVCQFGCNQDYDSNIMSRLIFYCKSLSTSIYVRSDADSVCRSGTSRYTHSIHSLRQDRSELFCTSKQTCTTHTQISIYHQSSNGMRFKVGYKQPIWKHSDRLYIKNLLEFWLNLHKINTVWKFFMDKIYVDEDIQTLFFCILLEIFFKLPGADGTERHLIQLFFTLCYVSEYG